MWFKNLHIYRLAEDFKVDSAELENKLAQYQSRDCGTLEIYSYGWDHPLGHNSSLFTHVVGDCIMICAKRVDKVLPNGVVNDLVEEKAAEIEAAEGRPVQRRERVEIKERVIIELLPRAFVQSSRTFAFLDIKGGWLVVDASSAKKAEELVEKLREAMGSLPVRPLISAKAPAFVMTSWLQGGTEPMGAFIVLDECELRDTSGEGAVVRCRHQDLSSDEIKSHLDAGKQAVKLGLEWDERIEFLLAEDLSIKRLRFSDLVHEDATDVDADDEAAKFDADFALMSLELKRFIPALVEVFGGLEGEGKSD